MKKILSVLVLLFVAFPDSAGQTLVGIYLQNMEVAPILIKNTDQEIQSAAKKPDERNDLQKVPP